MIASWAGEAKRYPPAAREIWRVPLRSSRPVDATLPQQKRRTIRKGLQPAARVVAVSLAHDRDGLGGGQRVAVAGAGVIAVAVSDDRAVDRLHRVDVEAAGFAKKPGRCDSEPAFRT